MGRPFRPDYIRLSVEWLEKYVRVKPADEAILYHPHEAVLDRGGMIFFALDGETPIGTVGMIPMPGGCLELAKLAVTESHKGQGVGKLLMEAALDFAGAQKCEKVILFTNRRLVPAIGLYRRYGFREVPMVDNEYEESDVRMELDMGDKMNRRGGFDRRALLSLFPQHSVFDTMCIRGCKKAQPVTFTLVGETTSTELLIIQQFGAFVGIHKS